MASITGKFSNIYKLMRKRNIEFTAKDSDCLKCTSCKEILIDPCQVACGCKYCRHCVDEMVANGNNVCSGITTFCKDESLSNLVTDYSANRTILQLVVKCPEEACSHQCELINLDKHIKLCSKKSVNCPFYGLGCELANVANDKLNDHFLSENYNHNSILVDIINNVKNDVETLKQNDGNNKQQVEILNHDLITKEELTEFVNKEIRLMKLENTEIARQIEIERQNWELKYTDMTEEIQYLRRQINDTTFSWDIDDVANKMKTSVKVNSEFFYPRNRRYKMRLHLSNYPDYLDILFCLYSHDNGAVLKWPYQANVTIKITNQANVGASKSVTNYCRIDMPDPSIYYNNGCYSKKISHKESQIFKFSYAELSATGLMQNNGFTIECHTE